MTSPAESHTQQFSHINGTLEEIIDRYAVSELCMGWPLYRHASEWMNFHSLFCKGAYVWTTWSGARTIDEFIEISKAGKASGVFIMHRECGTLVELNRDTNRAVGKMKATITQRFRSPEGIEYDVDCDCQFLFFCQRDPKEKNWKVKFAKLIYMKDKVVPVNGKDAPSFDEANLARFPEGYKFLGAAQSSLGYEIDVNLATAMDTEKWKRMYRCMENWLGGHDADLFWDNESTANVPDLTHQVIAAIGPNASPRAKEITCSLVRHLHAWVREVRLTQTELMKIISILNEAGRMSNAKRNETLLLCGSLGIESLVVEMESKISRHSTPSAILGPFYQQNAPLLSNGSDIVSPKYGKFTDQRTLFSGHVLDSLRRPIGGAVIEVWLAAPNGMYEQQDPSQPEDNLRAQLKTDKKGAFGMYCLRPGSYQIPDDGPTGRFLRMLNRSSWRPAHIHVKVHAKGYCPLTTQFYDSEDNRLTDDAVFAVKKDLVVKFEPRVDDPRAKWTLNVDIVLSKQI